LSAWLLWAPVVLQMALIFGASSLPNLGSLPGNISDKTGHIAGYALLSLLLIRALAGGRAEGITWRTVTLAIAFSTLYGASDEFHQKFVPGRSADVFDVLADIAGTASAAVIAVAFRVVRRFQRGAYRVERR
jgi:VanZ family protein